MTKLSEFIAALQKIAAEHGGDLPVYCYADDESLDSANAEYSPNGHAPCVIVE